MKFNAKQLKEMSCAVRFWALHALRCAKSGHIGIVLGAADVVTTIYANFLRRGRDKFVLSAGHGSALLYSVLKLAGYDVGDLDSFRKLDGLPGHPELRIDGVTATTGPLGQGIGNAVGLALAAKIKKSDETVYCLCSDGDLMEGVAQETIAFAGRYKLNNLVLLWDDNGISIDGVALTDLDVPLRMRAAGWNILTVRGDDFNKIDRAITKAVAASAPTFIRCRDIIGRGSSVAGTAAAHGFALGDLELEKLMQKNDSVLGAELWGDVAKNAAAKYAQESPNTKIAKMPVPLVKGAVSTRDLSGIYLQNLISSGVHLIGGSADLSENTRVKVAAHRDIKPGKFNGNFINYGVREHAMGAIMNGLAIAGLRPFGSTFLVFSDYMRPAIRLAAMSELPVIYVFSHDSIAIGEDGPTHQPIEQLASLRLIPNLNVFRPCNATETVACWDMAIMEKKRPSCMILSRQKIKQIETPIDVDIARGGYIIYPAESAQVKITIIATGSEVPLAVEVAKKLGTNVQVVSMPSVENFRAQDEEYKQSILRGFVITIEAGATMAWFEFADAVVGIDSFGTSGSGEEVYKHFGFDADEIAKNISRKIKSF